MYTFFLKILVENFYSTLLGLLIKDKDRVSARKLLDKNFVITLKSVKVPFNLIIFEVIKLLNVLVGVKKYKKYSYQVSFIILLKRKLYFSVK